MRGFGFLLLLAVTLLPAGTAPAHRLGEVLADASPYLARLHHSTPVRWWVWDADLWETARRLDRPVFVSVGYAACWWCHRFERESLRDPVIVRLLEAHFLPVVVDREAQPAVDDWLQREATRLGAPRGWPLQVVLTPEGEPIAAFGYRPPRAGPFGPGTLEELERARALLERRPAVRTTAVADRSSVRFDWPAWAANARTLLEMGAPFFGGFGESAKRLRAPALELLWRYGLRRDDGEARAFVRTTLITAIEGAAFDHLEGGFFRYLADPAWREPHFEKMLYTQAQYVRLLALVHAVEPDPRFADRIRRTVRFVARALRLPSGLHAGSLDAESAGGEGGFYRWDEARITAVLGPRDAKRFFAAFALDRRGVPYRREEPEPSLAEVRPLLARLAEARARRPAPARDAKAVLAWNALWADALIQAGWVLDEPAWVREGVALVRRFATAWRRGEGFARYVLDGQPRGRADVEDLAAAGLAALTAFEATGDPALLVLARRFATEMRRVGFDERSGLFGRWPLPERFVPALADGETMAAHARATMLLARLFHLEGREGDRARAERAVLAALPAVRRDPLAHASHLLAYEELRALPQIVLIAPEADAPAAAELAAVVWRSGLPARVMLRLNDTAGLPVAHPAYGKIALDGRPTAYVCVGPVCSLPATTAGELAQRLQEMLPVPPGTATSGAG